jgi:hypothetical protein
MSSLSQLSRLWKLGVCVRDIILTREAIPVPFSTGKSAWIDSEEEGERSAERTCADLRANAPWRLHCSLMHCAVVTS